MRGSRAQVVSGLDAEEARRRDASLKANFAGKYFVLAEPDGERRVPRQTHGPHQQGDQRAGVIIKGGQAIEFEPGRLDGCKGALGHGFCRQQIHFGAINRWLDMFPQAPC